MVTVKAAGRRCSRGLFTYRVVAAHVPTTRTPRLRARPGPCAPATRTSRPARPAPCAHVGPGVVYAVLLVAIAFEKDVSEWRAHAR